MNQRMPRFRMFAGPNGSGKSIIKKVVPERLLGVYVNPDEIEQRLSESGGVLDFNDFGVSTGLEEVREFFRGSGRQWGDAAGKVDLHRMRWCDGGLDLGMAGLNSYVGSVLAELIRTKLMGSQASFSTETVMSHRSKVELLREAQAAGYRTYLYYVATDDPEINCFRVAQRVLKGGHHVAENKIRERYQRSLDFVLDAIRFTNRAYFFDNSFAEKQINEMWVAEVTDGRMLELKQDSIPQWFERFVWDKLTHSHGT